MNGRAIQHTYRFRFLYGLSGTALADAVYATFAFIISVSSESIWVPIFVMNLPAALILALHAGLSNRIADSRHRFAFWLGFTSFLFGAIGAILIEVFIIESLFVLSYDDRMAFGLLVNILTVAIGILCQWIAFGFLFFLQQLRNTPPTG